MRGSFVTRYIHRWGKYKRGKIYDPTVTSLAKPMNYNCRRYKSRARMETSRYCRIFQPFLVNVIRRCGRIDNLAYFFQINGSSHETKSFGQRFSSSVRVSRIAYRVSRIGIQMVQRVSRIKAIRSETTKAAYAFRFHTITSRMNIGHVHGRANKKQYTWENVDTTFLSKLSHPRWNKRIIEFFPLNRIIIQMKNFCANYVSIDRFV